MEKEDLVNKKNQNSNRNDNVSVSKKTIYSVAGVIVFLLIMGSFVYFNKKGEPNKDKKDSLSISKKDSANITIDSTELSENYEEGEESPYSVYRVISKSIALPEGNLNFGDEVYVDESKSNEITKIVYLKNPITNPEGSGYSMNAEQFIDSYRFDEYKDNFSLPPFSELPSSVKKILLDKNYDNGNYYKVSQNAERAKSSVAYGDFDGDGLKDVSIIMDNNEKQISRLLMICTNKQTKAPYIAYAENYSDKMKIRGFKKNASIYMSSAEFVKAPQDGVVITSEDTVLAIVYDNHNQKFKTYYQAPTIGEEYDYE